MLDLLSMVPEWMKDAACRGMGSQAFFCDDDAARSEQERYLPGLYICEGCSVQAECLDYALRANIKFGIFGGKTARQRGRMRRKLRHGNSPALSSSRV